MTCVCFHSSMEVIGYWIQVWLLEHHLGQSSFLMPHHLCGTFFLTLHSQVFQQPPIPSCHLWKLASSSCPAACVCVLVCVIDGLSHLSLLIHLIWIKSSGQNKLITDSLFLFSCHGSCALMDKWCTWWSNRMFLFQSLIKDLHALHEEWLIEQKHVTPPAPVIVCIHCQQAGTWWS